VGVPAAYGAAKYKTGIAPFVDLGAEAKRAQGRVPVRPAGLIAGVIMRAANRLRSPWGIQRLPKPRIVDFGGLQRLAARTPRTWVVARLIPARA
jgi:hypothetical protein